MADYQLDYTGAQINTAIGKALDLDSYEFDLGPSFEALSDSDVTITNIYSKIKVVNNILYVVINYKATALKAISSKTFANLQITLPSKIAEKLVDMNGKTAHEQDPSYNGVVICTLAGARSPNGRGGWTFEGNHILLNTNVVDRIELSPCFVGWTTSTVGDTRYHSYRQFLVL